MSQKFRPDIQGIRGIAIVLVVLLHAGVQGFGGGFVGVELFFVLSGYVVTESALRKDPLTFGANLKNFYLKRISHLVPVATLVILATLFAAYFLLGPAFNSDIIQDARWSSVFGANLHFIDVGANYFIQGLDKSLLNHYWYLGIEQQVYLFFPLVFFGVARLAPAESRRKWLALVLFVALATSGWWSFALTNTDATSAYYSPLTRVWEVALGALVALIPSGVAARLGYFGATALSLAGLAAIGTAAIFLSATSPYPGVLAWWPALGTAALLWANEHSPRFGVASWLSFKPLRYLGDISYSLYLWHFVWLTLPGQLVEPLGPEWLPALLAGALICAVLSHHLIEKPLMRSDRINGDTVTALLVLLISVAVVWDATVLIEGLWAATS
jgi:peptidoglycan/LPS O-acetylase OafA/YrhL